MSLILDAIKKSERERNDAAEPSVQSIHSGHGARPTPASRSTRWGMLLFASGIIALGLWWFWPALNINLDIQRPGTSKTVANTTAEAAEANQGAVYRG